MKFPELWELIESKNPQMETGSVTMSSSNFKRAMRFAYDKGVESASGESNIWDTLFK